MEFKSFKTAMQKQFDSMIKNGDKLFLTDIDRDTLWDHYLNSFPEGSNPIFKERREYDCNECRQFIRPFANVVTIKDNKLISIWDIEGLKYPFKEVTESMSKAVKCVPVKNLFISKEVNLGVDKNIQLVDGKTITWEHFSYKLPSTYVTRSSDSVEAIQGTFRDSKNVFKRSMDELTLEAANIILELITQDSLYRGAEHKQAVTTFITYKKEYDKLSESEKDNWTWSKSFNNPIVRIRNTALGTLLIDLSADMEVDQAVRKFEAVMAPTNYKRPTAIITKKMIEDAETKLEELGLTNSLHRRFAQLEDITVNNVLFVNRDARKKLKGSVFDELKEDIVVSAKKFDKVEEVHIDDFMKNILPTSTNLELMMENRHNGNLISLIAPVDKDVPSMFKWDNNFSWAYNGDITDSMKQNVKNAGGNVDGVLRFSIQWNDRGDYNPNDFDAHCIEPKGFKIYFGSARNPRTTGNLDVDIRYPNKGHAAVENITWLDKSRMDEGTYIFKVHNFAHNGGSSGFSAEIEYEGQIYSFDYPKELKANETIIVAEINFSKKDGITFIKSLDSTTSSKEIWGLKTNQFTKVNVAMFSPNYWDGQESNGNKHYFFFMDDCKNEGTPRGFFNEFLNEELTKHRKVFEVLGSKMRVEESEKQLSGLGFSSTQRNSIIAKVDGSMSRMIKIIF
jgi:hypothetical protein